MFWQIYRTSGLYRKKLNVKTISIKIWMIHSEPDGVTMDHYNIYFIYEIRSVMLKSSTVFFDSFISNINTSSCVPSCCVDQGQICEGTSI